MCLDLRVIYVGDFICIILGCTDISDVYSVFNVLDTNISKKLCSNQSHPIKVIVHFYTHHTSWWSEGKSVRKEAGIEFGMKPFVPLSLWYSNPSSHRASYRQRLLRGCDKSEQHTPLHVAIRRGRMGSVMVSWRTWRVECGQYGSGLQCHVPQFLWGNGRGWGDAKVLHLPASLLLPVNLSPCGLSGARDVMRLRFNGLWSKV